MAARRRGGERGLSANGCRGRGVGTMVPARRRSRGAACGEGGAPPPRVLAAARAVPRDAGRWGEGGTGAPPPTPSVPRRNRAVPRRCAAGLREAAADRERRDPAGVRERLLAEPGSPERAAAIARVEAPCSPARSQAGASVLVGSDQQRCAELLPRSCSPHVPVSVCLSVPVRSSRSCVKPTWSRFVLAPRREAVRGE